MRKRRKKRNQNPEGRLPKRHRGVERRGKSVKVIPEVA